MHRTRDEIVLIGPHRAGKSTLAELLGERLGVPVCSLDRVRWDYYRSMGCDEARMRRFYEVEGFWAMTRWLQPWAIAMVERVLAEHRDCVFDFGAGHSMYDAPPFIVRVHAALAPFLNVVLVLPAQDEREATRILKQRAGSFPLPDHWAYLDVEAYEFRQPSNRTLATLTVHTHGRTPDDCCDEIIARIAARDAGTSTLAAAGSRSA